MPSVIQLNNPLFGIHSYVSPSYGFGTSMLPVAEPVFIARQPRENRPADAQEGDRPQVGNHHDENPHYGDRDQPPPAPQLGFHHAHHQCRHPGNEEE